MAPSEIMKRAKAHEIAKMVKSAKVTVGSTSVATKLHAIAAL